MTTLSAVGLLIKLVTVKFPVMFVLPLTSSFAPGLVVPIPTSPLSKIAA
jgi:hypothetical protein